MPLTTPTIVQSLATNEFPLSEVYTPEDGFNLVQGGPSSTDTLNSKKSAPVGLYIKDGNNVTLGSAADANTVNTVMGRLTKLRDIWLGLIGQQVKSASLSVTIASDQGNIPVSGTVTANVDATNSAHIANTDTATATIATQTTTTATNTGNIFTRLANIVTLAFDNTSKLQVSLYVKASAAADTILTLGRTTKAGSLPVTMASDQDAISTTDTNSTAMNTSLTTISGAVSGGKLATKAAANDIVDLASLLTKFNAALDGSGYILTHQKLGGSDISTSNPMPTNSVAQAGEVALYGSNPAALTANTDAAIKWGASGTTAVNHVFIQNNWTANINYRLDAATTAGSPVLAPGQAIILDVAGTLAAHIQGNGTPSVNGSSAGNIVVTGWL